MHWPWPVGVCFYGSPRARSVKRGPPLDFRLDFRISTGFFCRIEKARLRRWALCALRTPRSQAERALHRTSQKAAVRAIVLVCATSRGCRWVVSSAHPAREAAGPLALVPRLPPHPRHLAGACCSHIRPNMHTHTHGAFGHRRSCAFCRFWRFARAPLSHAPRLLAPAEPRFAHRTFSTHPACSMVIAPAACAFPGLPLVRFAHDAT